MPVPVVAVVEADVGEVVHQAVLPVLPELRVPQAPRLALPLPGPPGALRAAVVVADGAAEPLVALRAFPAEPLELPVVRRQLPVRHPHRRVHPQPPRTASF
jgi:hypothetical protein